LNPFYRCGDVVVLEDLVDLTGNRGQETAERRQETGDRRQGTDNRRKNSGKRKNTNLSFLLLPLDGGGGRGVGVREPDTRVFNRQLTTKTWKIAQRANIPVQRGTYIGVLGPNYETCAEYRFLRRIGDVVGMSTVHEVRAARQLGLQVLGLSVVSNECCPDHPLGSAHPTKTTGESVLRAVEGAAGRLSTLITSVCSEL
jgi:purine nucleoside phosphorylase